MTDGGRVGRSRPPERTGASEAAWLETWMANFGDPLTRFAFALAGSRDEAQEIAQETFFRLLLLHRRKPGQTIAPGWLFTVARNLYREAQRRRARQTLDGAPDVLSSAPDPDRRLDVFQALDRLPTADRECLWLFYYADLSVADLARMLHISEQAVKTRLHRARERFSRIWGENHDG